MTQEELAERSGLASDTIRRIEKQNFSPSLKTLCKLCGGLQLSLVSFFGGLELPDTDPVIDELVGLLEGRSPKTISIVARVVRELLRGLED